jgi:hypothetical protein
MRVSKRQLVNDNFLFELGMKELQGIKDKIFNFRRKTIHLRP